jgi:thiamine biosynthesis protein ThiS
MTKERIMLRIIVNGKLDELDSPITISDYLKLKGVQGNAVVERNLIIVKRDAYGEVQIQDNDKLEIVQMMAGG